jgi:arylsulfatase A-like enzyme
MEKPNVFLLTLDELRPDDLSCYGQKKIETPYMDIWAGEGVLFEETRAVGPFTPVCLGNVLSGTDPNKHCKRDAFKLFNPPMTIAEMLKINGYKTAAFTSAELLVARYGYDAGFDEFHEPVEYLGLRPLYPEYDELGDEDFNKKMLEIHKEAGALDPREATKIIPRLELPMIYWWINDLIPWLEENRDERFFVWCHFYETHVGCENFCIYHGFLKEGVNSEDNYHLGKVEMADEFVIRPIIETMKKLGLYDDTVMILQTDHGTHLGGDRPIPPIYFASYRGPYPSHPTLYDVDVRIANIWRGPGLPEGVRVEGQVRTVDTVPTILDLCGIEPPRIAELDGVSLLPSIERGRAEGLVAYMEQVHKEPDHRLRGAVRPEVRPPRVRQPPQLLRRPLREDKGEHRPGGARLPGEAGGVEEDPEQVPAGRASPHPHHT